MEEIKLTQYSHGAGCGCKISPKVLDTILGSSKETFVHPNLLVGNHTRDDAAVYDTGDGKAIISTTDFFMPIVDNAFDFGRVAAVNSISDIYAMGGTPMMAIAILGWPVDKLPAEVAQQVVEGGRHACEQAGISLAGGHSIDSPEPIFGLAVTGSVETHNIKRNDTATVGCKLFLSKPLGVGILTTAEKKGLLLEEHAKIALELMVTLNDLGKELAKLEQVKAMTDVTGFGLLGHLMEICEGSGLSALIEYDRVPRIDILDQYLDQNSVPGGTDRNWDSYRHKIGEISERQKHILCDPQTSGGL
ncbi:MAG: selenide, water dikinase SelD, partial [Bacteroidetes bacterium]|nr:selenide, water dikinase SelD [Bacteroidota bacterium]